MYIYIETSEYYYLFKDITDIFPGGEHEQRGKKETELAR